VAPDARAAIRLTVKNNRNKEVFVDRISVFKVLYCLRPSEERKI
jgi:predicted Ser/Thr protein kinase